MRAVIQRVRHASVAIDGQVKDKIAEGVLIFLGVESEDGEEDITWLSNKVAGLRIFPDEEGKMNLSVRDVDGEAMVISQFTLHAKTRKGTRPSYVRSAPPEISEPLYERFIAQLSEDTGKKVASGEFGAYMAIDLCNDGPVTLLIDTKNKDL